MHIKTRYGDANMEFYLKFVSIRGCLSFLSGQIRSDMIRRLQELISLLDPKHESGIMDS
jgi:hypothetical protein